MWGEVKENKRHKMGKNDQKSAFFGRSKHPTKARPSVACNTKRPTSGGPLEHIVRHFNLPKII